MTTHRSEADLFALLDSLGIAHRTYRHPPVFTVEEARALRGDIPGAHCKNLFLIDRKGGLWLAVALEHHAIDLTALAKAAGTARFSFGNPALLAEVLGVEPGSVTPFALVNDRARRVTPLFDAAMLSQPMVGFHPLANGATTTIRGADLVRFAKALGHEPVILAFPERRAAV